MQLNTIFSISTVQDSPMAFAFGADDELVTRNTTDLQNFKRITSGHTLIMGRKTFESMGSKALPNRKMVIISNMDVEKFEVQQDCFLARSLDEAIKLAETEGAEQAFVIGGANIVREAFIKSDRIYYTIFNTNIEAKKEYVYLNMAILTQSKFFATDSKKDYREVCTVLGEERMVKFRIVEVIKSSDMKKKLALQGVEKKALKADRKARKMARKLYARTRRAMGIA